MKKLPDLLFLGLFLFVVGLFFYPTLFNGKLPIPTDSLVGLYHPWRDLYQDTNPRGIPFKNFLITDPVRQQIPWRKIAINGWQKGMVPTWNPYAFAGVPLVANIQAAVFYPFNALFSLFDFPYGWTTLIILEPLLAGFFFYLYVRHLGISPVASVLGAVSWSFSGFSIAWLTWGTIVHVALWIPLILLSLDNLLECPPASRAKKNVTWLIIFIGALSAQFFAGHTQISFYVIALSFIYALWKLWHTSSVRRGLLVAAGTFVAVLITSVQWIPTTRLLFESGRVVASMNWLKEGWFLPWQHLVQILAPDFFGNPTTLNYWGQWNYGEFIGYIGVLPLVFAFYAVFWHRDSLAKFWVAVGLLALLFMLPTPVAKLPYVLRLPFLSSLQPTRLMVLFDFSLVMLTSLGINQWLVRKDHKIWYILGGMSLILVVFWGIALFGSSVVASESLKNNLLVTRRNLVLPSALFMAGVGCIGMLLKLTKTGGIRVLVTGAVLAITTFDLLRFSWKFTPFTPLSYFYPETQTITFLKEQQKPFRVMSIDKRLLPPNVSSFYGIETIEGYDPIYPLRYEEFMAASERGKPNIDAPYGFDRIVTAENLDSPLLPLLGVRYILSLTDINKPHVTKVFQEGQTRVYEDTRSFPRVFPVEEVRSEYGKQRIIDTLFDSSFDARKTALIEDVVDVPASPLQAGEAAILETYTDNSMIVKTNFVRPRFMVVTTLYDPGWKATVDGVSEKLYRTDYVLTGLVVPDGSHTVRVSYE